MPHRSPSIRQAKRQAKLTNVGLTLACLDLFADFMRRCPRWMQYAVGAVAVVIVWTAVLYWYVTITVVALWIVWKARNRILWTVAGVREWNHRRQGKDIPY